MKIKLIVALDVDNLNKAKRLVKELSSKVDIFKVGSQLFTACGPKILEIIHKAGARVFLDLKLFDIPNTVANAARAAARLRVSMFDLHVQGGIEMLRSAAKAAKEESRKLKIKPPKLIGITILTSDKETESTKGAVLKLARQAKFCGLDGVVCSVNEAETVRRALGKNFLIITPGIRPESKAPGDQKRVATPKQAKLSGANYIVVGRPVIKARNPSKAAEKILKEIT